MLRDGLIRKQALLSLFLEIEPILIRYPSLDPLSFREIVEGFCNNETEEPP